MATELGWAIDFLDKPADNLDFNFWSGRGDLTLQVDGAPITYKGANGIISMTPPREEAAAAAKMTAVIDASDPNIRQQLRRDIGPCRVRLIWLYRTELPMLGGGNIINRAFSGNPSFGLLSVHNTGTFQSLPTLSVFSGRFTDIGGLTGVSEGTEYWFKKYGTGGTVSVAVYTSEGAANDALDDPLNEVFRQPRTTITMADSGASSYQIEFASNEPDESKALNWKLMSKRFVGRLSAPNITGGIYTVDIESMLSDIDRARTEYWSNDTHLSKHPGDKSFEYMREYALNGIDTKWPP